MRRRRGSKIYGTPSGPPRPQGIDDRTGFKVDLSDLRLEWDQLRTTDPDIRNPQDFVKGVKDDQSLPFARPESPDVFIAENVLTEDGAYVFLENGEPLMTEGVLPSLETI